VRATSSSTLLLVLDPPNIVGSNDRQLAQRTAVRAPPCSLIRRRSSRRRAAGRKSSDAGNGMGAVWECGGRANCQNGLSRPIILFLLLFFKIKIDVGTDFFARASRVASAGSFRPGSPRRHEVARANERNRGARTIGDGCDALASPGPVGYLTHQPSLVRCLPGAFCAVPVRYVVQH
jgi:hypothetical protein